MGRVVLRTVWEENIEWNLFSVQTVFGDLHINLLQQRFCAGSTHEIYFLATINVLLARSQNLETMNNNPAGKVLRLSTKLQHFGVTPTIYI
jgi:hypothetical protein